MKKEDMFFGVLEIVGSVGICVFAMLHIQNLDSVVLGPAEVIFQICLASVVILELGVKGINKGLDLVKKSIGK